MIEDFSGLGVEAIFGGSFGTVILSKVSSLFTDSTTRSTILCTYVFSFEALIGLTTQFFECFGNATFQRATPILVVACGRRAPAL